MSDVGLYKNISLVFQSKSILGMEKGGSKNINPVCLNWSWIIDIWRCCFKIERLKRCGGDDWQAEMFARIRHPRSWWWKSHWDKARCVLIDQKVLLDIELCVDLKILFWRAVRCSRCFNKPLKISPPSLNKLNDSTRKLIPSLRNFFPPL